MKEGNILIVDDDEDVLTATRLLLEQHIANVRTECSPSSIPSLLQNTDWDVVLLDMNYGAGHSDGAEGFFWLKKILSLSPSVVVILITAYGHVEMAVQAMKQGATDFVLKPWQNEKLLATVYAGLELSRSRLEATKLKSQKEFLNDTIDEPFKEFIGQSVVMQRIFESIHKVAATNANVLILGEHGTGKELAARALHRQSPRSNEIFVSVDMGSIPDSLFESELFGHTKGAFTDAKSDRPGRFEIANGGTLFLDEIGNLPLHLQTKLLAVLQNREVFRVGSAVPRPIDIRLICATNVSVQDLVDRNHFRQDLLYRINTVEIVLPPLRDRDDDIDKLAEHFVRLYSQRTLRGGKALSPSVLEMLRTYSWPGNVRELQHVVERAVILSESSILQPNDFSSLSGRLGTENDIAERIVLGSVEKATIQRVLAKHDWNISSCADELGITRASLYRRMKKYGL